MTDEQIDNLQPGRQLDRLIAQHVFGLTPLTELECNIILEWEARRGSGGVPCVDGLFRDDQNQIRWIGQYSTEIRDAWEIVNKMKEEGFSIAINNTPADNCKWACYGYKDSMRFEDREMYGMIASGMANTPALAICRCALKMAMKGE